MAVLDLKRKLAIVTADWTPDALTDRRERLAPRPEQLSRF